MLQHSKACIYESLTRVPDGHDEEEYEGSAVMNFRNVLVCMGDRPAQHCQRNASRAAIVYLALSDTSIRDEVYIQVLKQLNGNKSERGVQLGFELLLRLCQKAPASGELAEFLRAFLREEVPRLAGTDAQGVAKACLMQLDGPAADEQSVSRSRFHSSGDDARSRVYSSYLDEQQRPRARTRTISDHKAAKQDDPEIAELTNLAAKVSQRLDGAAARLCSEVTRLSGESAGRGAEIERLMAMQAEKVEQQPREASIAELAARALQAAGRLDSAAGHVTGEVAQLSARASSAAFRLDQAANHIVTHVDGLSARTAQVTGRLEVAAVRLEGEVSRLKAENEQQAAEIERLTALLAQKG